MHNGLGDGGGSGSGGGGGAAMHTLVPLLYFFSHNLKNECLKCGFFLLYFQSSSRKGLAETVFGHLRVAVVPQSDPVTMVTKRNSEIT